ncbi:MAG: PBP1A family penicillin-binding protein [Candidatus Moranbacteria bacterium]|nr:PBP1A family penicillin-binding protein [Candidatus Moranbacteria bacterium]
MRYKWQNLNKKAIFIKTLKISGIIFLVGLFIVIGIFAFIAKDLPEPGKVNMRAIDESTKIYDRTGTVILYDIHGEEKRTIISHDEIPDIVKQATVALEDENFYHHIGFDIKGLIRAILSNVFGIGQSVGGSTITQQFVKNSILTNEKRIERKIKELILAIEIEMKFEKDDILGMYLNEIPYGSNAYGIEAAAQTFFNKNAKDLTLDEATILASLPQAPSKWSPYGNNREHLKSRQEKTLNNMVELGYISAEQSSEAKNVDVFVKLAKNRENIKAPHFVFYVREYLEDKYGAEYLEKNGLKVITTLDWKKQEKAQAIVKEIALENKEKYNAENAALVAIDPKNGDILTMIGSRDYFDEEIDGQVNVTLSERQPGSSFKPYAYLHAFEKGYTPETIIFDVETKFETGASEPYEPQNYDGTFRGPVKLKEALSMSLNIPAVKVLYLAGPKDTISFVKRLGITGLNEPDRYGLSLVLGGGEIKLVDHVAAYSVFANNGVKFDKRSILKVEDKNGEILEEVEEYEGEKIVEEKYISMLSHSLSHNKYRSAAFGENNDLKFDDNTVAAKTGTTNENRDAWTIGYTPEIAIGVWGGNNDNSSMSNSGGGSAVAAPIFRKVLLEVFSDSVGEKFPKYDKDENETKKDILDGEIPEPEKIEVCEIPGKDDEYCEANKYCPEDKWKKRKFADIHNILYYVKKDDPQGDKPEKAKDDPQYKNWEKGVKKFYEKDSKMIFEEKPDECKKDDFDKYKPEIKISVPDKISEQKVEIKVDVNSPYDVEKIEYFADGSLIKETKDKSVEYDIPDSKDGSEITFSVKITDSAGNTAESSKKVKVSIPKPETEDKTETPATP